MVKHKSALGKGLGALLEENVSSENSQSLSAASVQGGEQFIDVNLLKPNPYQPRSEFEDESLQELAASIKEHGIIQPILAEETEDGLYFIIAGERRTRAAKLAGLTKVPVIIKKYSDEKRLEIALIENIQREDLNAVEEARAYENLMIVSRLNQDEAAQRVGKKRSTVANALRLLKLPEDMLNAVSAGKLSAGHARALLSVVNPSDQRILFARILGNGMSVREAEAQATALNDGGRATDQTKKSVPAEKRDAELVSLEQQFIDALGTKVVINGSLERGTVQIGYFSADDLDRLYNLIVRRQTV